MTSIDRFKKTAIEVSAPVNFYNLEFRGGIQTKEKHVLCKKYKTKNLRTSEFYKSITCFIDYSELRKIKIEFW
jgi:hypothetical protein